MSLSWLDIVHPMTRRALVIGSQTHGLTGVHGDMRIMQEALTHHGFAVRQVRGKDASREGIIESYRDLIQETAAGDSVVVYYAGHGDRATSSAAGPATVAGQPTWLQYIVPSDIDDRTGGQFRGLLAEELSALQRQLTEKTENVTSILDCCHSARMFRDPFSLPRAYSSGFPWEDVLARWHKVRTEASGDLGDANPNAVQVVACAPDQSAYELRDRELGASHGALTAALVRVLCRDDAATLSWREVLEIVRPAILDRVPSQRPDLLGPRGNRLLFSTQEKGSSGVLSVLGHGDQLWVEQAALFGVAIGDRYGLVPPGGSVERPAAVGVVREVVGDRAWLSVEPPLADPLPSEVLAHPIEVSLGRRPVAVSPADHPDWSQVVEALRQSKTVRVEESPSPMSVLATLHLTERGVTIADADGQPLSCRPIPVTENNLRFLNSALEKLARATYVRNLDSGSGNQQLDDDVLISYSRLDDGVTVSSGDHLFNGDRVLVRVVNRSVETRYVSLLDIGLTGAVSLLTVAEPSGVTLAAGEEYVIGENAAHVLEGFELYWPEDLPATGPRPETILTLVSNRPVAGLAALEQAGVRTRSQQPVDTLTRLIADLAVGTREARPPSSAPRPTQYRVSRLDFLLHSSARPSQRGRAARGFRPYDRPALPLRTDARPNLSFRIDARPDPSFLLVAPQPASCPPTSVSVRLSGLGVGRLPLLPGTRSQVHLLVASQAAGSGSVSSSAHTVMLDRGTSSDLAGAGQLLYDGPVGQSLDLAVWVSDDDGGRGLDELLQKSGDERRPGAGPARAYSAEAVDDLIQEAALLLVAEYATTSGVYRTTFLPYENFGAGQPALRHPSAGVIEAGDISLAFEITDRTRPDLEVI